MEHQFHLWLKKQTQAETSTSFRTLVGMGDDAAVQSVDASRNSIVVATDSIAQGTHFELPRHDLTLIGRKALAVNLSDIAAMGAKPESVVLHYQLPKNFDLESAKSLFRGAQELASQFDVSIIGGDTNRWNGGLVVGATVIGSLPRGSSGWSLGGMKNGDAILVSGAFGGSIHGRHLTFEPRCKLANYLFENYSVHAATDASDSLSLDLMTMVRESGLGVELQLEKIPVSKDVQSTVTEERIEHALNDGEDFELILSMPVDDADRLTGDVNAGVELTRIGTVVADHKEIQYRVEGKVQTLQPKGYIH